MDFLVKHWAIYPRRFRSSCPVEGMDFLVGKTEWIDRTFKTCNFSLILKDGGEFNHAGKCWIVNAPCVITQWPGEPVRYGPKPPHQSWDELYLIYNARCMRRLQQCGFIQKSRPVWTIHNPEIILGLTDELRTLSRSAHPELFVDRVDHLCERLILETLLPPITTEDQIIRQIILHLQKHPHQTPDFSKLAWQHGMSLSTLRRRWWQTMKQTPARYLIDLRIRQSSRMLAETHRSIAEIASAAGFEDAFYFSRRFKLETGITPSEYRRRHQLEQF
ncbi:MAG: AraC family transcriptional regulator [Verrucomicrobiales bacterium]|nr:AraC family transcriptional regulator [Verrucomicrobiales bacterium]